MDCLCRAYFLASPTPDTFCTVRVIHRVNFHLAGFCTFSTVDAFLLIYTIAKYRYFIKYRIKSSQRADIFAKWSIYHNSKKNRDYQNHIFPEVKPSHCTSHGFIQQNQRKTALQRSCRTDQFAEIRCSLSHDIYHKHWQKNHKYYKNDIFQFTKQFISTKRPDLLWKRNFIQQVLNQAKWAKKSTDQSAKQCPDKNQKTHYIRNNSSVPEHTHVSIFLYISYRSQILTDGCLSVVPTMPGFHAVATHLSLIFSYPIPIHSIQILIAFVKTTDISPL